MSQTFDPGNPEQSGPEQAGPDQAGPEQAGEHYFTASPAAAHRCSVVALTVWLGTPGNGTAGSTVYDLEFSNTSKSTPST